MKRYLVSIITILAFVFITNNSFAQCKGEVKDGIKKLSPYTHNGQINNGKLTEGKATEFHISVYKGLKYRMLIVSDLSNVQFKVYDEEHKEIYNSSNGNTTWEFTSTSSQELTIEVVASDKTQKGCVGVVMGMQTPASSNPIRNL